MMKRRYALRGFLTGLFLSVAMSASASDKGSLKGTVVLKGTIPAPVVIKTDSDPACQQLHPHGLASEDYVVGKDGALKNVFIYVKQGLEGRTFPPNTQAAELEQSGCQYKPHVIGIQANQPLEISNSDPTLHNVNAQAKINEGFNIAQPVQGMKTVETFSKAEFVPLVCNVHPWMKAIVGVFENPFFAVSDDSGRFEIRDLPPGQYVIGAWHEKLGTTEQKVTIKAGESQSLSFVFTKS